MDSNQQTDQSHLVPWLIPAVLILNSSAGILSTDLYVPSMPDLVSIFSSNAETIQLTMSLNIRAFALGQLIYGPLADRFGRRPVLLSGLVGFLAASILCAWAQTIDDLLLARVAQGLMASSEAVIALIVIRDLYSGEKAVKILAYYGMALALTPAVGPIIGGYIHVWLGWRANFLLLSIIILICIFSVWRFIPETAKSLYPKLRLGLIVRDYFRLMKNRNFLGYAVSLGAITGVLFAFITEAPFLLISYMDIPTENYGYFQGVVVVAFFLGSFFSSWAVRHVGTERLLQLGYAVSVLGTIGLLPCVAMNYLNPFTLSAFTSVFAVGMAMIFATGPLRAMDATATATGIAAALLGAVEMLGAAAGSGFVTFLHDGSPWALAIVMSSASLFAAGFYALTQPWRTT